MATSPCPHCGDPLPAAARSCPSCAEPVNLLAQAPAVGPIPISARNPKDKLFCEIAIDLGHISHAHATQALEQQRIDDAIGQHKPVGAYLHNMGVLSRDQIAQIVRMQDRVEAAAPASSHQAAHTMTQPASTPAAGQPTTSAEHSNVSRTTYVVLGLFLGCLGIHNFAAGYVGRGVAQLLITLALGWVYGLGIVVTAIWAIAEIIAVTRDSRGRAFT